MHLVTMWSSPRLAVISDDGELLAERIHGTWYHQDYDGDMSVVEDVHTRRVYDSMVKSLDISTSEEVLLLGSRVQAIRRI
jgi:hypothetical protein